MRYCTICWDAPAQKNSPYCAACGKIQKRISQAKADKAYRERHKPKEERENLDDDVAEIEAYNERHRTALSYGKWRAMVEGRT